MGFALRTSMWITSFRKRAGLWNEVHWASLLFAPALTFLLFAIDEIGVQLEEPFSVLPLAQICDKVRANVTEIVELSGRARALAREEATWAAAGPGGALRAAERPLA